MMIISTYLNAAVVLMLSDGYYNIDQADKGAIAGKLVSYSLLPTVAFTLVVGYVYDIFGRRWTLYISFMLASTLMFFIPRTAPVVFPSLLLVRMGVVLALVPPVASPLVADYLDKSAIGKGAALIGVGFIIGEIICMGGLFTITKNMTPNTSFLTVAIIGNIIAVAFLFIVKEPQLRQKESQISREEARALHIRRMSTVNAADAQLARQEISQIGTNEGPKEEPQVQVVESFTDEAFESMSLVLKFGMLSALLVEEIREKRIIAVCWSMFFITRLYTILFSTFWLLYLVAKEPDTAKAAHIY
jgi:MFS family permease